MTDVLVGLKVCEPSEQQWLGDLSRLEPGRGDIILASKPALWTLPSGEASPPAQPQG